MFDPRLIRAWYKCSKCNGAKHAILQASEASSYFYICQDDATQLKDNELVDVGRERQVDRMERIIEGEQRDPSMSEG